MPTIVTIGNTHGGLVNQAKNAVNSTNNLLGQFDSLINAASSESIKNKIVNYKNIAINSTKEQKWRMDAIMNNASNLQNNYKYLLGVISAHGQYKARNEISQANRIVTDTRELTNAIEGQYSIANQAYKDALAIKNEPAPVAPPPPPPPPPVVAPPDTSAADAAAARARAKAAAKAEWDAAQALADAALERWRKEKAAYDTASDAIPPLKIVYDNAQLAVVDANSRRAIYDDALAQQMEANKLLTTAIAILVKANNNVRANIEKTYDENAKFIKNAAVFPNTVLGIDKEYNPMTIDWAAYNTAKTELSKIEATKIVEFTGATDKLVEIYNKFIGNKDIYAASVINLIKLNTSESEYIKNNRENAEIYEAVYGLMKEYKAMVDAWAKVTNSVKESDAYGVIVNYNAYLPTKTAFAKALLLAQNKRAEADFQAKLAAGKDAAAKWKKSGVNGCRNIQTDASTDLTMLDQDIACNDTEYISGYTKVSGFNAAPTDPNVSQDNIGKYLAVKYSCCTAPAGIKGPQGKKGLPGLDGLPGPIGPEGPEGKIGPVGRRGPQGDDGEEGDKGPRGERGDDGDDGEQGLPGRAGKSVKAPRIRQVPGPRGVEGEDGSRGQRGPKGPDGKVIPAPVQPFSELDRTIGLFNIQDKIKKYLFG